MSVQQKIDLAIRASGSISIQDFVEISNFSKKDGFYNSSEYNLLVKEYGIDNVLNINSKEMSEMLCNFFSISENIVVSDYKFDKLNTWLEKRNIKVVKVKLNEVGKQGGLFRCSTLPLIRL